MAAGLGFKDFTTGEVLTAADVDGYLMQGVWVFASAAARDAAVTSPQEGNFAYLKDTNVTTYYTGSAWANLDTTGMTNPMTTTGDMIYSSSGSTPARLGIGTANQQLRVNAGATAPEWFTPTAGASGLTLVKRASFSNVANTGTTYDDVFTSTYKSYMIVIETIFAATSSDDLHIQFRYAGPTTQAAQYYAYSTGIDAGGTAQSTGSSNAAQIVIANNSGISASYPGMGQFFAYNVGNSSQAVGMVGQFTDTNDGRGYTVYGVGQTPRTYTGFILKSSSTNITGTVAIYGLATA